jgi:hypothetical protein
VPDFGLNLIMNKIAPRRKVLFPVKNTTSFKLPAERQLRSLAVSEFVDNLIVITSNTVD